MSNTTLNKPPWEDNELSYTTKLFASLLVIMWLLVVIGVACYAFLLVSSPPGTVTTRSNTTVQLIGSFVIVVGGIFAFFKWMYPFTNQPTKFMPRNSIFSADQLGQNFEVRFMRARGRTFYGKGDVRFAEKGFVINGTLPPPVGVQLLVILVVTVVPLIIFRFGLGLLPALLIAQFIGKESVSVQIPYEAMQLVPKGRTITITALSSLPRNIKFRVATTDGERFYRELDPNSERPSTPWQPALPPSLANPL